MFVIEVRPKKAWRVLRLSLEHDRAWATTRHDKGAHFYTREAAVVVDSRLPSFLYNGKRIAPESDRRRIVNCDCRPTELA